MTKNPLINAATATVYIAFIAAIMFYGNKLATPTNSIFAPIAMISLFTLSAAVMGYLFGYQPTQLYLDGKKKQAINLFLQTVGVFGGVTAILIFLLFSGLLK